MLSTIQLDSTGEPPPPAETPLTPVADVVRMQMYTRLHTVTLENGLDILTSGFAAKRQKTSLYGFDVAIASKRLRTFAQTGTTCVCCGMKATYFALERCFGAPESMRPHLNLWGVNAQGEEVLFTRDHIRPRSRGGEDTLANSQTMCGPCNWAKKDTWTAPPRTTKSGL